MPKNTHQSRRSISRPTARRRAVTFVGKAYSHDPHERISSIGGVNYDRTSWRLTQEAAIEGIESGKDEFYIATDDGPVDLVVTTVDDQKYLQRANDLSVTEP
ncbi:MAG TPA: DUF3892 domain-containing protein [Opitutaceae bacterium]